MSRFFTFLILLAVVQQGYSQVPTWVGLKSPENGTGTTILVEVQVYEGGLTEGPGQGAGINCETRYGSVSSIPPPTPVVWNNVTDVPMAYSGDVGNNDKYAISLTLPTGYYQYTCRCRFGTNVDWKWSDGSDYNLTFGTPLAVELTNFRAKRQAEQIVLTWATASEQDHDRFVIERAGADMQWRAIHEVVATERNSVSQKNYTFTDEQPLKNTTNHYRLRSVGTDGSAEYSKVVVVALGRAASVSVYPNPVVNRLFVDAEEAVQIVVLNTLGQQVMAQNSIGAEGVDMSALQAGTYQLLVQDADGNVMSTERFVKQ